MSWNSPKGDDSSTSSKSSCTPLSSNNSFSCPRPQSPAWSVSSKGGNTFTQYSTPRRSDRSLSSRPQSPTWSVSSKGSVNSTGYITPMRVKTPPLSQDRSHQAYLPHSEICDRSVSRNRLDGFIPSSSPGCVISCPRSQDRSDEPFFRPVNPAWTVSSRDDQSTQYNIQSRVRSLPLSLDPSHLSYTQSQESPGRHVSRKRDDGSIKSRDQISETYIPIKKCRSANYYRSRPLSPAWAVGSICGKKSRQDRTHQSNHIYLERPNKVASSKDSNKPNQSNLPKWGTPRLVKASRSLQNHQNTSNTLV